MSIKIQKLFFRVRDNGALVFRVDLENRQKRLELVHIANVNVKNGNIKPHGSEVPTQEETDEIEKWSKQRRKVLAARIEDDADRLLDDIAGVTHWIQSEATDTQIADLSDRLLMAMHDLRVTLIRKNSDRIMKR